jgi:hypothetical protein
MMGETYRLIKRGDKVVQFNENMTERVVIGSIKDFEDVLARVKKRVKEQKKMK